MCEAPIVSPKASTLRSPAAVVKLKPKITRHARGSILRPAAQISFPFPLFLRPPFNRWPIDRDRFSLLTPPHHRLRAHTHAHALAVPPRFNTTITITITITVLTPNQVLSRQDVEDAVADAHDALDAMSMFAGAGPIGAAVREMEARKSAASGAAGGFTYAEFYRLLASMPSQNVGGRAGDEENDDDDDDDDDNDDDDRGGYSVSVTAPQLGGDGRDGQGHYCGPADVGLVNATRGPAPPVATGGLPG